MTLGVIGANTSLLSAVLYAVMPFAVLDVITLAFFLRRDISS
jgi:hypothetical protein